MAYFSDLTPYAYGVREEVGAWKHRDVLHVGWLDGRPDFPKGDMPRYLVEKLRKLAKHPVELYRGRHICELCRNPEMWSNGEIRITVRTLLDGSALQAAAETLPARIEIESGLVVYRKVTYAAPILIVHYIEAHGYCPPAEFLKALEAVPNEFRTEN